MGMEFIKGGILIYFKFVKNNQVELLYQNPNSTVISRKYVLKWLEKF